MARLYTTVALDGCRFVSYVFGMTSPVFADVYALDLNGQPDIPALVSAGLPWAGIGLKATEGIYYPSTSQAAWFQKYWPLAKSAAGTRYGQDWFRWCYHYLRIDQDPVQQAEFYLRLVQSAGGWADGDLWPVVDVETSQNPATGPASKVIDVTSKWAARVTSATGRRPVLYAGSYIRDLGITDHMGCQLLWTACYSSTLPSSIYTSMGWQLSSLFAWQYQGTEAYSGPAGYPRQSPVGTGPVDLSAVTIANGSTPDQQLAWIRAHIGQ